MMRYPRLMSGVKAISSALALTLSAGIAQAASPAKPLADTLKGTVWQLESFTSMDDAIGVKRPEQPEHYTLYLTHEGRVGMRLDCNRAMGGWSADAGQSGVNGSFRFTPLAGTMAMCPTGSMDQSILRDTGHITGFALRDGKLHLSLKADAGIYSWTPLAKVPASPGMGGPASWQVTGVSSWLNLRKSPNTRSDVLAHLKAGTELSSKGCDYRNDRIWCEVATQDGKTGFVAHDYLKASR
ncbi:META domain-containing protein [Oceanospirillum sanctuarii]|uniref:META domain-containing protein n=1 Tax=Oceanospirillum sanctuarii TaxID=1434821 RepID=UPI0015939D8A|nr:META domain-containing protein [Oceanospirillum sanctuarii]